MLTAINVGTEGSVGIRGRKAMKQLSREVRFELGFEGCIGVQQIKLKKRHSMKWDSRSKGGIEKD